MSSLVVRISFIAGACLAASPAALACCSDATSRATPGEAADDNAGHSVAGGFDFDGDGFHDVAVGAIYSDRAASAAGAVMVVHGGSGADGVVDQVLVGDAVDDDHFGSSVASPGDWDGDGADELAVGARLNDRAASAAGAVFVFAGGDPASGEPLLVLTGETRDSWFGQSVSSAGDFDGDGWGDLVVGAPYFDGAGNASGRAYVFFGGPSADATPDLVLDGESGGDHFGWGVGGGGDVNGDGFDDVVVGARLADAGPLRSAGRAYLYLGGPTADAVADRVWDGAEANGWFGEAVAVAGDTDGDGFDDVVVGSRFSAFGAGTASLILGGDPPATGPAAIFTGPVADGQAGSAVAGLGDLNGDGLTEWGCGAPFDGAGVVHVFCGADPPSATPMLSLPGTVTDASHGASLASAGEGDGDPGDEIVAGQPFDPTAGLGAGSALRWSATCAATEPLVADFTWTPTEPVIDEMVQLTDASTGAPSAWEWDLDGDGALDDAFVADPTWSWGVAGDVMVTLRVSDGARSDETTKIVTVSEESGDPPGEVSAPGAAVPFTVRRDTAGDLVLRFESLAAAQTHAAYAGSLAASADGTLHGGLDHVPLACALATIDVGGGAMEASVTVDASAYLLVTAANTFGEGPIGRSSGGTDRGALACP